MPQCSRWASASESTKTDTLGCKEQPSIRALNSRDHKGIKPFATGCSIEARQPESDSQSYSPSNKDRKASCKSPLMISPDGDVCTTISPSTPSAKLLPSSTPSTLETASIDTCLIILKSISLSASDRLSKKASASDQYWSAASALSVSLNKSEYIFKFSSITDVRIAPTKAEALMERPHSSRDCYHAPFEEQKETCGLQLAAARLKPDIDYKTCMSSNSSVYLFKPVSTIVASKVKSDRPSSSVHNGITTDHRL